ncbi:MAG: RdgB/HAM1 family non-canonical purine NTP pyrophosphatase [Clostridia bacterium]|nr:RdgB/HAM1 family non-canonical purine NTP pyrophosphatase [Clostridia bacterium]
MRLVIASNNAHKIREIREMLGGMFDEVISMAEAGIDLDVVEDGTTFMENALKKAHEVHALLPDDAVLSDDSGLSVDALGGAPGVYSARFALDGHDDSANRQKLLRELRGVPDNERSARFECAMVLCRKGVKDIVCLGKVEGRILFEERGENGFGYDSLFYYEPAKLSFAEMTAEAKNHISHRHMALQGVLDELAKEGGAS